jgi:hypothetical protein
VIHDRRRIWTIVEPTFEAMSVNGFPSVP